VSGIPKEICKTIFLLKSCKNAGWSKSLAQHCKEMAYTDPIQCLSIGGGHSECNEQEDGDEVKELRRNVGVGGLRRKK